ncbi:ricin-type beta-trefoil lectin domain protein [Streptomyces sp. NPDC087897]|uniref:ricin-type beta-trefoil lectin domain protein n=1 Tax=Streptomyces sp. NPDC087897 TaxID=3365817 RepID=UPI0037FCDA1D
MTPSSPQQTPASQEASAKSGAETEGVAANSATGATPAASIPPTAPGEAATPASGPAPAKPEAVSGAASPETGEAEGRTPPDTETPETTGKAESSASRAGTPEAESDPGASAAAQSRLPALVRTMSATAIGRPQQETGPVGRPGRAALAGAAVVGALLVSVPFLVLAGDDGDGPERTKAAGAGTVLDGSGQEAPGEFAVTAPETSAPAEDGKKKDEKGKKDEGKPAKAGDAVPAVPSGGGRDEAKKGDAPEDPPKKAAPPRTQPEAGSGGTENQPAKAKPAVTFSGPVSFRSHLSGRCIDVPGHNFNDGQPLFMWDCNGADAQKWRYGSDGTIRARDKCLDVANANFSNGSRIQLAWCNGSDAQKFALNAAHDLVNTVVGKCVDIPNHSTSRGPSTYLILWDCTGLDNQKWST